MANFVLDVQPWPLEGDKPVPNPDDPDSYLVLYTDLEDLYGWMLNEGYAKALEASVKNYSRD
jgi:hypothetical protein